MASLKVFYRCRKCDSEFDTGRETPDADSWSAVCTEILNPDVMVMKSAQDWM
jgi:hypothetical protein